MRGLALLIVGVGGAASVEAAPFAWLAHDLSTKVSRIDLATHETVLVTVGDSPIAVAGSPDGLRAYSADYGASALSVIDAPNAVVVDTIPLTAPPMSVAVHTDSSRVYVLRSDEKVDVIDAAARAVVKTLTLAEFGNPLHLVMNAAGTRAYVDNFETEHTIAVINTVTDEPTANIFVDATMIPAGIAVAPDGTRVYAVVAYPPGIAVVDATTGLLMNTIPLSDQGTFMHAFGIAVGADGTRAYVVEQVANRLAVVDLVAGRELTTLPVGNGARGVDVTPDGSRAYVVNYTDASLSIIDTATDTIAGTILTLASGPLGLGDFIAPGPVASTTSTTSTTTTSIGATTSTSVPPQVLSSTALGCQRALGRSWKRFSVKAHALFASCFDHLLRDVAAGQDATDCAGDLDPAIPTTRVARLRSAAHGQIVARCAGVQPADIARPCSSEATTIASVADCVLDAQLASVVASIRAEYGLPCSLASATGVASVYPGFCE